MKFYGETPSILSSNKTHLFILQSVTPPSGHYGGFNKYNIYSQKSFTYQNAICRQPSLLSPSLANHCNTKKPHKNQCIHFIIVIVTLVKQSWVISHHSVTVCLWTYQRILWVHLSTRQLVDRAIAFGSNLQCFSSDCVFLMLLWMWRQDQCNMLKTVVLNYIWTNGKLNSITSWPTFGSALSVYKKPV